MSPILRATVLSNTCLSLVVVAALVAMGEINYLIGQILPASARVHEFTSVIGPTGFASIGAWEDWTSAPLDPSNLVHIFNALDVVFFLAAATLLRRLLGDSPRARVAWLAYLGSEVIETFLIFCASWSMAENVIPGGWAVAIVVVGAIKWLVTLVLVPYLVLTTDEVRQKVVRTAIAVLQGLYAQRLGAIVVGFVGLAFVLRIVEPLEQAADVERGWVLGGAAEGQFSFDWIHAGFTLLAFVLAALSLHVFGRRRAHHYWTTAVQDKKPAPVTAWEMTGPAVALVAVLIAALTGADNIDWGTLLGFLLVLLVFPFSSRGIRWYYGRTGRTLPPPLRPTDIHDRAPVALVAGELLVVILSSAAFLGLMRAFVGPVAIDLVVPEGSGVVDTADRVISIAAVVIGVIGGIGLPVALRWLEARWRPDYSGEPSPEDSGYAYVESSSKVQPRAPGVLRAVSAMSRSRTPAIRWWGLGITVLSAALILTVALIPRSFGGFVGPLGTLVVLLVCWTNIIAALTLWLGRRRPLAIFQLLRLRSTPLVALLVVLPLTVGQLVGAAAFHAIRQSEEGTPQERLTLREAFEEWVESDDCSVETAGSDAVSVRPLLLTAAEGGGIRAATWTVDVLAELAGDGECAAAANLLSTGASGGSIGLALFNDSDSLAVDAATLTSESIAGPQALGSVVAGLLTGDFIGSITGVRVPSYGGYGLTADPDDTDWAWQDRIALQQSVFRDAAQQLDQPYDLDRSDPTGYLVLNSADAISSCKVVISQLELYTPPTGESQDGVAQDPVGAKAGSGVPDCNGNEAELANAVDLQDYIGECIFDLDWATAAALSARFPFISPAGRVSNQTMTGCTSFSDLQLVDGGYIDNSGLGTLSDLAPEITSLVTEYNATEADGEQNPFVVPVVMFVDNYTGTDVAAAPATLRPELILPLLTQKSAQLNQISSASWLTRLSRTLDDVCTSADAEQQSGCESATEFIHGVVPQGVVLVAPSTTPSVAVPLGWTLSSFSIEHLEAEAANQARCPESSAEEGAVGTLEADGAPCVTLGEYGTLRELLRLLPD